MKDKERITQLELKLKKYRDIYYNGSDELQESEGISDAEYDLLENELRELDPTNELLAEVGSPVTEEGREKLVTPMLSQEKALTPGDSARMLARFDSSETMVVTEKLDGCGLDITYIDGEITSAVTRGTWIEGTQVVEQAKLIQNLPHHIAFEGLAHEVHVRGEVVIKWKDFEELNEEQERLGQEPFSNPRNLAAGTIKLDDLAEVKRRRLWFVGYEAFAGSNLFSVPANIEPSYYEKIMFLKKVGFTIPQLTSKKIIKDSDLVNSAYSYLSEPEQFPYAIDGIVIRLDNLEESESLGATIHHPRCSFAVKPLPEAKWVTVDHIDWTLSRLGTLTPTAVFSPVSISGANISRVNMHNLNNLERTNCCKGTRLKIIRSGLVIPKAVDSDMHSFELFEEDDPKELLHDGFKLLHRGENTYYYNPELWKEEIPEVDPSTGSKVHIEELTEGGARVLKLDDNEANYFAVAKRLEHFFHSIRALGWGETLFVEFCYHTGIKTISEFIDKVSPELIQKSLTSSISDAYARKLSSSIKDSLKNPDLALVVKGLGIDHAQSTVDKALPEFNSAEDILNPEIWKKHVTPGVFAYIKQDLIKNHDSYLNVLKRVHLNFETKKTSTSMKLAGKSFVITGTLSMPRNKVSELIKQNGGKFMSVISSNTSYLLAGAGGGSKRAKAESLGVPIISEDAFMQMLK